MTAKRYRKVVLAYSGGLDTSVSIRWIQEHYHANVVTLTVNVGQEGELSDALERAEANGAERCVLVEAQDEFARDFLAPAIRANALYEGVYPLSTSLARPLVVRHLVGVAHKEGADAVAHGCTGKGNDQVRFDIGLQTLDPTLGILAPVREWNMNRTDEIAYARTHGIRIHQKPESPYSVDENLWGRSIEGGVLEDPAFPPPEEVFQWTSHPDRWPEGPEEVRIGFDQGLPVSLDGRRLPLVRLIRELNRRAGRHGVGRIDLVEDRVVGIKSRETYECPAAVTLISAHQALESLVFPRDLLSFKALVERRYSEIVYEGLWYSPLRQALEAFVESTQAPVTGEVTVRWHQGGLRIVSRTSPYSLLSRELSTYGRGSTFPQGAAEGFIHLFGLPNRLAYSSWVRARAGQEEGEERTAPRTVLPPS
jgi:argininosuccinate synthase